MADISAWSPVDESNTASPPNGWPENMQVSAVNNSARAMMGAVRRFYDKLNDGSFVFGNITCSGNMSVSGVFNGSQINASGNITTASSVVTTLDLIVGQNAAVAGTLTAAQLTSIGNINVAGTLTAGEITSTDSMTVGGTLIASYVSVANNITGGLVTSTGDMNCVNGTLTALKVISLTGTWMQVSDDRLKRNVEHYTAGLDELLRLTPRSFEYTGAAPWPGRSYGLMASEVADVVPEMVGETEFDGVSVRTLASSHAVYLLINACKELAARVATLEGALTHEQR